MLHHKTDNEFCASRCEDPTFVDDVIAQLLPQLITDQYPTVEPAGVLMQRPDVTFIQVGEKGKTPEGLGGLYGDVIHTLFLPSLRGGRAVRAAQTAIDWVWDNTNLPAIRSFVFSHRPEVALFARLLGFEFYGAAESGATVGGVPVDKYNLALKRPCL